MGFSCEGWARHGEHGENLAQPEFGLGLGMNNLNVEEPVEEVADQLAELHVCAYPFITSTIWLAVFTVSSCTTSCANTDSSEGKLIRSLRRSTRSFATILPR